MTIHIMTIHTYVHTHIYTPPQTTFIAYMNVASTCNTMPNVDDYKVGIIVTRCKCVACALK